MTDEFVLDKGCHLVLYGAASFGSVLYKKLTNQGIVIDAYIDQRAEEIHQLMGVPVYALDNIGEYIDVTNVIVLLSVKNVFEHTQIATQLVEYGLYNLLYKPLAVLNGKGTQEEVRINTWYERIIVGDFPDQITYVPCTKSVNVSLSDENDYILAEEKDQVIISAPLTCLFQKKDLNTKEEERNILCYFPHIQFFKYLQGDINADIGYYIDYCKRIASDLGCFEVTKAWENNVIRNRTEICARMEQEHSFKRGFFTAGAPTAVWNERGYFNIENGQHRAAFIASKEMMFLPIKISRSDLKSWLNEKKANEILDKLQERKMDELHVPIEHPKFYEYPCKSALFYNHLFFKITEILCKAYYNSPLANYLQGKNIYLSLNDWGLFGRYFRRCGANIIESDCFDHTWNNMLDELFNIPKSNIKHSIEMCDVGIWQIECMEMMDLREGVIAQHSFYMVPAKMVDMRKWKDLVIHCGIIGEEKMCVIYQEKTEKM